MQRRDKSGAKARRKNTKINTVCLFSFTWRVCSQPTMDSNTTASAPAAPTLSPASPGPNFLGQQWPVFPAIPALLPLSVPLPQLPLKLLQQLTSAPLLAQGAPSLADVAQRVRSLFIPPWLDATLGSHLSPYLAMLRPCAGQWAPLPVVPRRQRPPTLTLPHPTTPPSLTPSPPSGLCHAAGTAAPLPAPVPAALPCSLSPRQRRLRSRHCAVPAVWRRGALAGPRAGALAAAAAAPAGPRLCAGHAAGRAGGLQGHQGGCRGRWRRRCPWPVHVLSPRSSLPPPLPLSLSLQIYARPVLNATIILCLHYIG